MWYFLRILSALCLRERAARGDRAAFDRVLAKVPNAPPVKGDRKA